jgi:hypothetical protein
MDNAGILGFRNNTTETKKSASPQRALQKASILGVM